MNDSNHRQFCTDCMNSFSESVISLTERIFSLTEQNDIIEKFFLSAHFSRCLPMSAVTRTPAKAHLEELRESIKRSPTRRSALMRISKERGISVDALRMAAKRAGLVSPDHSLKYAFSEMEEKGLVLTCLIYARQYTPL